MANPQFFYFYTPTWDYPPNGPIKLGNIITTLKRPHRPLVCSRPLDDADVLKTTKKTVQYSKEKSRSGHFSILTRFLSVLGIGVDVGVEAEKRVEESFTFQTLETTEFIPTQSYLQKSIENEAVARYLSVSRYRKPVYIITGLKIVTGAEAKTEKYRSKGANLEIEVDGTLLSGGTVPVGGGPGVGGRVSNKTGTSWEGGSDFVFAFRVSKVFVRKKTGLVDSEEEYQKGAMLGQRTERVDGPVVEVVKVVEAGTEGEGFDEEIVMDDGEAVFVGVPRGESDSDD